MAHTAKEAYIALNLTIAVIWVITEVMRVKCICKFSLCFTETLPVEVM